MTARSNAERAKPLLFLPTRRQAALLAGLGLAALGTALFLRYGIIQNTPIGLACEAGEGGFLCAVRLTVILMFTRSLFGWIALIASCVQLWRPNVIVFGVGLVFALMGLVLYNTGAAALAVALLLLSLARPVREAR